MNKKLLSAFLIAAAPTLSFAQSTLLDANFSPVVGDQFIIRTCDTTGVAPGAGGAAHVWDFTSLVTTGSDTGKAVSCLSTSHCSMFPGSTLALKAEKPTHIINYIIANSTALSQNGYYLAADTNLVVSDPIDQIHYPFTYPNSFTDAYAGIVTLGPITAHETGTVNVVCDGYGTLKLPGRTDTDVLRVHSTQNFVDSASLFGSPVVKTFVLETYTWYKPNYHTALFTIATTTEVGGTFYNKFVSYAPSQWTAVSGPVFDQASLQVYPNPAKNELNIQFTTTGTAKITITITDMLGREVGAITPAATSGTQHTTFSTSTLPDGCYLLRLCAGEETIIRKVVVNN